MPQRSLRRGQQVVPQDTYLSRKGYLNDKRHAVCCLRHNRFHRFLLSTVENGRIQ